MPRVIIIEDSPTQAQRFALMLQSASFEVECAELLSEGLDRIKRGGIDALLLDLTLPDSEGIQTFLTARAQAPGTPLVVLTSLDDESVAAIALQQGAHDYLVKSEVNQNWLIRSVQHAIARGSAPKPDASAQRKAETLSRHILDVNLAGDVSVARILESRLLDAGDIAYMGEKLLRLLESGCRKLLISFLGVEYVSNGAMSALLAVRRKMLLVKGTLRLCSLAPSVFEHLSCRQFHKLFDIRENEEAGLKSFEKT